MPRPPSARPARRPRQPARPGSHRRRERAAAAALWALRLREPEGGADGKGRARPGRGRRKMEESDREGGPGAPPPGGASGARGRAGGWLWAGRGGAGARGRAWPGRATPRSGCPWRLRGGGGRFRHTRLSQMHSPHSLTRRAQTHTSKCTISDSQTDTLYSPTRHRSASQFVGAHPLRAEPSNPHPTPVSVSSPEARSAHPKHREERTPNSPTP